MLERSLYVQAQKSHTDTLDETKGQRKSHTLSEASIATASGPSLFRRFRTTSMLPLVTFTYPACEVAQLRGRQKHMYSGLVRVCLCG